MVDAAQWGQLSRYASLREPAFRLIEGAVTFDKPVPIRKFADKAGLLGWNVRKQDLAELMPDARFARPMFANVRDDPTQGDTIVLGTVGARYFNFQVEQMLDTAEEISRQFRAETMGTVGEALAFMQFAHADDIVLDPKGGADTIRRYFTLYKAFDGTSPLTGMPSNTRVRCENTFAMAINEFSADFKVRHTQTMEARVAAAVAMSQFADKYDDEFSRVANELYARDITNAEFDKIVKALNPEPDESKGKGAATRFSNSRDRLYQVWNDGTGSMENLPRNAWRAFNALTEDNQWNRQIRQGNVDNALAAGAGFDSATVAFRESALSAVREIVLA